MSIPTARLSALAFSIALLASTGPWASAGEAPDDDAPPPEHAAIAERFARALIAGDEKTTTPMLDATMTEKFGPEAQATARAQIAAGLGPLETYGEIWRELSTDGYDRYRLPATFQNGAFDLIVVLSRADTKVAGFFVKPQVPRPDTTDAPQAPGREIEMEFGAADLRLPGILLLPEGDGPFPAVVLVHGSGPQDRDETVGARKPFRDLAWGLARRGIASLRYDKRTQVHAAQLASLVSSLTVKEETVDDAVDAVAWLRARGEIDPARVFVVGHSLGGMVAPRIVARVEPKPAGAVLLAGLARPLPETVLRQVRYLVGVDGDVSTEEQEQLDRIERQVVAMRRALDAAADAGTETGGAADDATAEVGPPEPLLGMPFAYIEELESVDNVALAARLGVPFLVLQGGRDINVTEDDFALWKAALADRAGSCFRLYPSLDHFFVVGEGPVTPESAMSAGSVADDVVADIARFVLAQACPE